MAYIALLFVIMFIIKMMMIGAVHVFGPIAALVIIPLAYYAATRIEPYRR